MKKALLILIALSFSFFLKAQVYSPVANYFINGTPHNGVKIKTNIPFQNGLGMPTLIIEGYSYGSKNPIGLTITWYVYYDDFYMPKMSSWGAYTPEVKLAVENGKIIIFINDKEYYDRFTIRAYANGMSETASMFDGWSIVDEAISGTNIKIIPYENRFAGNIFFPSGKWTEDGELCIGTTSPNGKLSVSSQNGGGILTIIDEESNEIASNPYISFYHGTAPNNLSRLGYVGYGSTGNNDLYLTNDRGGLKFRDSTGEVIYVKGGNVGIATDLSSNPNNYKLAVNGTIGAKGVKVEMTSSTWSDFVFNNDYKLKSLEEVEKYVNEKNHLPDIPTAKEVGENGVNLGEMDAKLLQKIEELTLYIIEQNKKIEDMQNQINELKK